MRSLLAKWYETKVQYEKTMDDGSIKKVRENYVVNALSFAEAEANITESMESYVGEFEVVDCIRQAKYKEVIFSDDATDDKFYKAKLQFITLDEKTEKEKMSAAFYLVQAGTFDVARKYIKELMAGTMIDYKIDTVSETNFIDVFEIHK